MEFALKGSLYPVEIIRKNNKNTYIRIKDDKTILVTTNYLTTKKHIQSLLETNREELERMMNKKCKQLEKEAKFYYLGHNYDILYVPDLKKVEINGDTIMTPNDKTLKLWKRTEMIRIMKSRLDTQYQRFEEKIPYPKLKIRTMKTRWGVCNRRDNSVTLNAKLLDYEIRIIDYVIIHELSHFVWFNHSKNFWLTVNKYCPEYKFLRKSLKE